CGDTLQATRNLVERLVPGNSPKVGHIPVSRALGDPSFHGIEHTAGRIDAIQVLRNLRAEETACDRMIRIALNFRSAPVLNGDQDATGVRAIMWAGGMNNFLHGLMIIRFRRARFHRVTSRSLYDDSHCD